MNGVEAGINYAFKGFVKDKPYLFFSYALTISVLIPGYCLRIFERPLIAAVDSGQDFNKLTNCYWFLIITMTTIGYGDYSAWSNMGRMVAILIMLWGVFIVSLMVVTLNS